MDRPSVALNPRPPFTGMALDRASERRKDPAWVREQLHAPAGRVVLAGSDGVLVEARGDRVARRPAPAHPDPGSEPILLGLEGETPLFARDLDEAGNGSLEGARVASLRDAGAQLPRSEGGLAAYATALLNWHRRHGFCANCGAATAIVEAGYARRCPRCGAMHFPRTDPVVIMLVHSEGRLLLGHRTGWPAGRYSVLAGFVSPGEAVEEAVVREVREEACIEAHSPTFVTSQPWPFPASLMLGFEASSDGGEPAAHDGELDDVRWFTRAQVSDAANGADGELGLPPPVSIARLLIDRWLAAR